MDIKAEEKSIKSFVDTGNYHAAYNIAISGLNECRRIEDYSGVDEFISIIRGIVDSLDDEFGNQTKSPEPVTPESEI